MKITKTRLFASAGVVAIAGLAVFTPRAAQAVAAALVQVTNTTANPVVTESTTKSASQLVLLQTLAGGAIAPGSTAQMNRFVPGVGPTGTPYTVPAGQSLVITEMDINAYTSAGAYILLRSVSGSQVNEAVSPTRVGSQQMVFSSGIVFTAGDEVQVQNAGSFSAASTVEVVLHGYLTSN